MVCTSYYKNDDEWKEICDIHVKHEESWKKVCVTWKKIEGEWQQIYKSGAVPVDYLVVAGGGAGGGHGTGDPAGGGGGAGGFRASVGAAQTSGGNTEPESTLSLNVGTAYTVSIGGGGGVIANNFWGGTGTNSVFATITSNGGGGGARHNANGLDGGSGGGAGGGNGNYTGGSGISFVGSSEYITLTDGDNATNYSFSQQRENDGRQATIVNGITGFTQIEVATDYSWSGYTAGSLYQITQLRNSSNIVVASEIGYGYNGSFSFSAEVNPNETYYIYQIAVSYGVPDGGGDYYITASGTITWDGYQTTVVPGVAGQGNDGGDHSQSIGGNRGSGGGGAGQEPSLQSETGGNGLLSDITGTSTYYAGGGGGATNHSYPEYTGGAGGAGGGGAGGNNDGNGSDGTANTGGGGGGGSDSGGLGGDGGSGIVVVNYSYSGSSNAEHNLTISTGSGAVDINGAVANIGTLSITSNSTSSEASGIISTDTVITKAGSGTLLLSANNTYTGQTNINAGIVKLTAPVSLTIPALILV